MQQMIEAVVAPVHADSLALLDQPFARTLHQPAVILSNDPCCRIFVEKQMRVRCAPQD